MSRLARLFRHRHDAVTLRESLEEVLEEHEERASAINPEERTMLMNVLGFGELWVDDVMVPRADIVAVELGTPLEDVARIFRDAAHSRLPIYRETLDDVVGMVHVKDVLTARDSGGEEGGRPIGLADIRRGVLFVPPSMPILDLLLKMRATRIHMALVVDEYGGIDGLATIEDIVEEIVGEIEDEHDTVQSPRVVKGVNGTYYADARLPIEELERELGLALMLENREEDIDTLGGLLSAMAGRVPHRGELVSHPAGIEFEVVDADPRRVKRVRVRRIPSARPPREASQTPVLRDRPTAPDERAAE